MPNTDAAEFELHPKLAADTHSVIDWPICRVLLMNDERFPWLILVPAMAGLRELHDIASPAREQLWAEVDHASRHLAEMTQADKMNVAALGNQVPQLHIHVIARFEDDTAWPNPVWGHGAAEPYADALPLIDQLRQTLK